MLTLTLAAQGRFLAAFVLIAIGVAMAAWTVANMLHRRRVSHQAAWRRVSQRLGMSRQDSVLMDRAASVAGLRTPLSLIVSDRCYDRAVRMYQRRVGVEHRLVAIRQLIYETSPAMAQQHRRPPAR